MPRGPISGMIWTAPAGGARYAVIHNAPSAHAVLVPLDGRPIASTTLHDLARRRGHWRDPEPGDVVQLALLSLFR